MRLNGAKHGGESMSSSSTNEADDMLETENESLRERVSDLEKKVLEHGDEIVCLRSTLADVLRRLAQLESTKNISNNSLSHSSPVLKNGTLKGFSCNKDTIRYRPLNEQLTRDPVRRVVSYTPSSLPQRRGVHYQSTGSLHSDSPSSSSVSPVPTSPRPLASKTSWTSNLHTSKRWSSTGDFNHSNHTMSSQLHHGHNSQPNASAQYNEEESSLRMYLRGRPIILYAPSELAENYDIYKVAAPPQTKLKLDWVYGYRGKDCRSNLYLLPTGEIVYFVAAVAVLYNVEEQNQRHYLGHTDDIKCLAIHPNKILIATGQVAGHTGREGKPHIRIWNSVSLATNCILGIGEFDRSISCLSFSKADAGTYLCAIDEGNDYNISVWDWQKSDRGHKITETKCSVDTVVAVEFHPLDRNSIVTCGKSHITFWTIDAGGTLYKRQGIFEGREKPKYVTCLAFTQAGEVLSGDTNGNIIVWTRGSNTVSKLIRNVHEGSVFSICVLKEGSIITAGGKDGRLLQFDFSLQPMGYEAQIAEHLGGIRTVSEGRGSQLIVGTTRNCILVGSLNLEFSPVVLGHTDELWALAAHPSLSQFLTAGFDRIVQLWDSMSHSVVWSKDIAEQAQSATFSPDGTIIIVGCVAGLWLVMDSETREVYSKHYDGNEPIQVVKFSPNGQLVALGSRDNYIYVYKVSGESRKYTRIGKCSGHSSYITHLDWSEDNRYIRSNSGDYELLFWNTVTCKQVPQSSQLRDVAWASNSCTLTFTTVGIWPESADGTDVNACERSFDSKVVVSADDFGKVKLYSYPATQPKSLCHQYGGHSSHVTNVAFLHDDSRVITTGGKDTSVMQWQII